MRDLETIAGELAGARAVFNALAATNLPTDVTAAYRLDAAYQRAGRRFYELEDELRAAIEAEKTPERAE